jgi:outer membrane protein OmpA-like peptidoglycan-associated protein
MVSVFLYIKRDEMKKLNLITLLLFLVTSIASADCIMVKELKVEFKNASTAFMDPKKEEKKIEDFKNFINKTDLYVLIEGHTNKLANARYNYELSTKRAVRVMNELVKKGLPKSHVRAMGFGESTPLYSNETPEGLEKNRRVVAEVFNTAEELEQYIQDAKKRIEDIKFKEQ